VGSLSSHPRAILMFGLIHRVPALTCSRFLRARGFFSRMVSALAVHLKGFGLVLRFAIHSSMAVMRSSTLLNTPRRIFWRVISANSRSTRFYDDFVKAQARTGKTAKPRYVLRKLATERSHTPHKRLAFSSH